jgi:hypothetical protein
MQHPSDAAAGSIDLHSSAGACQRVSSHLQLHVSTVTVLLAAAWALILHATESVLACIASGVCNQTAAAKAHLLLLKRSSPSRFYRRAAASPALTASHLKPAAQHQQSCSTDAGAGVSTGRLLRSRHASTKQHQRKPLQDRPMHRSQPCADVSCSTPSTAAAGNGPIVRIPMQLQEHRGRLTIALDLDETLLCTYRLEHTPGCGDMLQLVPSNRAPGAAHKASSTISSGGMSWSSLLGRASSFTGSSSGSSSSNAAGSYSISTTCSGLPSDLGAAARASAWMHFTAPSAPATRPSGSSSGRDLIQPPHQQQQPLAPHTLAVFLRPGCLEFLQQLSCFAEVVLFTAASPGYAAPLAQLLDPSGQLFRGRLYGDACTSHAGRRGVKDLEVGT